MDKNNFEKLIPFWSRLSLEEKKSISGRCIDKTFSKGDVVNSIDTSCMGVAFIIKGQIRICIVSDEGREITLFRVNEGDCCVTTASCVIKQITFDTVVYADTDTEVLIIPSNIIASLMQTNIYVKAFIYEKETERFSQVVTVLQEMIFNSLEKRLAKYLANEYEKAQKDDIKLTQEEVARDINSARETVARMLGRFSAKGLVEVHRGHIRINDIEGIKNIIECD